MNKKKATDREEKKFLTAPSFRVLNETLNTKTNKQGGESREKTKKKNIISL